MTEPQRDRMIAIVNARVWSGDPRRPWADAVLVRGDRIEAVGSSAEVRKRAGAGTRLVDAKGMTVVPGAVGALAAGPGHAGSVEGAQAAQALLRAGLRADLAVLDGVLARVDAESIAAVRRALVMVGGLVVYDRDGMLPR